MSLERRDELIREICALRDVPGADEVLARGVLDIDGFDVAVDHFEEDGDAVYVTFQYGVVTAGRTLRVFRLLLEARRRTLAQELLRDRSLSLATIAERLGFADLSSFSQAHKRWHGLSPKARR